MATAELLYRYARRSSVDPEGVALATSGPQAAEELYFRGFLERPDVGAASLLCVARVARTWFYVPPGSAARAFTDPAVTSESGTLRFESFSVCYGVHVRFDIDPDGVDAETMAPGTVNVDFNEPMRASLARVVARSPLQLQVGFDAVEVQTLEGSAIERRVPLPDRWVKGFSEVQVAVATSSPRSSSARSPGSASCAGSRAARAASRRCGHDPGRRVSASQRGPAAARSASRDPSDCACSSRSLVT